jgi:hypothetical protein
MKSYVYAILDSEKNCLKIGKTNDVDDRIKNLQVGNPTQLKLIATISCYSESHAFAIESELHREYSHLFVRGEWFKYDDDILKKFVNFNYNNQNKKTRDALITNTLWEDHHGKFDIDDFPRCYFYPEKPAQIMGQYEKVQNLKIKWRTMKYPTFGKQMLVLPDATLVSPEVDRVFISNKKHEENLNLKRFYKKKYESINTLEKYYE